MSEIPAFLPIVYRDFHDVPRTIVVSFGRQRLLLSSPFDDELDDYRPTYAVMRLPDGYAPPEVSWEPIGSDAIEPLGTIPVNDVAFDRTLRKLVSSKSLLPFLARS